MKKITTLLLALIMMLSLAACSPETTKDNTGTPNQSQNGTEGNNSSGNNKNEITFTELVAIDNADCLIKITGIDPDNMWGYTIKALLENKSSDKTYMFSVESAAINGVQCDPFFASEVAAGKKANESITFMNTELKDNDIGDYTDIELTFRVYDSDDWSAEDVTNKTIHIYPYGEGKAAKFERESASSDKVLLDNDNVTVIVTGYEEDEIFGYNVNLFLVNKTSKNLMFTIEDASINGFMIDPLYATSILAGKCAFSNISWFKTSLTENNITEIETIEFVLRAYDEDNLFGDDLVNETVTLNP